MSTSRIDALRAMLAKSPGNALARYGLANELVKAGAHAEAVDALKEYLTMHDDQGSAFRLLAECYVALGKPEDAKDAYRRGIEAAGRHGHPSMADEFALMLEDLEEA